MSTPHMSGRTDAPTTDDHRDATDLLDEDGEVDLSTVWQITNAANGATTTLDAGDCADLRAHLMDTRHAGETARAFDLGETATRRHAKGECHHVEEHVEHPPLTYSRGGGWEVCE